MVDLTGSAYPRPTRIAFLVEDGDDSDRVLDGIFADCYDRWGGRFSLIAPCVDGCVSAPYWSWLEAFDPDLIYSYVPLGRQEVLKVHERLYPGKYNFHDRRRYIFPAQNGGPRLDLHSFKPDYTFEPLSSLSTIFRMARYRPTTGGGSPLGIIDKWPGGEAPTRFLMDNFGTYLTSRNTNVFPNDAQAAASLLTIVLPEIFEDRRRAVPRDLRTVPTEVAAFADFAMGRATSMSVASVVFAPKLDVRAGHWSTSFNLVVGNSFADRIMFWNARLLIPSWLDNDLYCLRVDEDQLADAKFLSALGELLKRRNHVNAGSGGPAQLTVRSCSLTVQRLKAAEAAIKSTNPWGAVTNEQVPHLDAVVPTADAFSQGRENNRIGAGYLGVAGWKDFVWTPPTIRPPAVLPDHLSDAPTRQIFNVGYWSTDYFLERDGPTARGLVRGRWELPRRWRMAGAFKVAFVDQKPVARFPPAQRRGRAGTLAISQNAEHPVEAIVVPTAERAIAYALAEDGAWARPEAEHGEIQPPSKVVWTQPSNEARYFEGVLGMIDGLDDAEAYLLQPFLKKMLAGLGGTPNLSAQNVTPVVNLLKKQRGRSPTFDLRSEHETTVLASLIVKAAKGLKAPVEDIGYKELHDDWAAHRAAYWERHPHPNGADPADHHEREEKSLDACLKGMRKRKMLFQGHLWPCRQCHHKNWIDMSALTPTLTCEVCGATAEAPVDIRWRFRPNQFLIESLRDHSVLSLVWVLSALRDQSRSSFMYAPPTSFGFTTDQAKSSAEGDLFVISDGYAVLCEVKSSWGFVKADDFNKFSTRALRLRPDKALFAVMEERAGPVPAAEQQARQELSAVGIKFAVVTPHPDDRHDSPYLHQG